MKAHLCTNCGTEIKPVVAVDIDGTLGDFHAHFLLFLEAYLQLKPGDARRIMDTGRVAKQGYDGSIAMSDWACYNYQIGYRTWQDIKLAYRQGAQKRSMPMYPGAPELLRDLAEAGAEVWMTTTRPYMRLDNIDPDTRAWLDGNGLPYHYMLYDEAKYRELRERVGDRVVGVLDDLPEQLEWARDLWGEAVPVQRCTWWNRGALAGNWDRAPDLGTAATQLLKRVRTFSSEAAPGTVR